MSAAPLPKDAVLVELKPECLTFETRQCLLPGTRVTFALVMEGSSLPLEAPADACLVMDRDRAGYVFHSRLCLTALADSGRSLIALFIAIARGRGSPGLTALGGAP